MQKIMFAQFVKVNEATGKFTGIAAEEIPDQAGEIFDYEGSKPLIMAWSDDSFKHSGGKSRGNLRAMHNPKLAAGLLTDIIFNDELKRVEVSGQVIDPGELEKLARGVYTGLSFGGSYAWRKQDGIHVRYAAQPVELSLADKPCGPTARFTLVKADGSEVETDFAVGARSPGPGASQAATPAPPTTPLQKGDTPKEGEDKYGDVKFADAKNKKYPIDTEKHIRAAWNYLNKVKNAAKYDEKDLKTIKDKIIAAWKEKIDKEGPPAAEKVVGQAPSPVPGQPGAAVLQKGLYQVGWFGQLLDSLMDLSGSLDWEAISEMDDSPLPGQFKDWLSQGCQILKAMAAEELDELLADLSKAGVGQAPRLSGQPGAAVLYKAGARHSSEDMKHIQAVHDHAAALGADCPGAEKVAQASLPADEELAKTLQAKDEELAKVSASLEETKADLAKIFAEKETLTKEVERLKAEPAPAKGALRAGPVAKEEDGLGKTGDPEKPRSALEEIAAAHQRPFLIR